METQSFTIKGRVIAADDPQLQDALALVYDTPERPRCLCVPGGVEMYVALHVNGGRFPHKSGVHRRHGTA